MSYVQSKDPMLRMRMSNDASRTGVTDEDEDAFDQ